MKLNNFIKPAILGIVVFMLVDVSTINVKCLSKCNVTVGSNTFEVKIILTKDSVHFNKTNRIIMGKDESLTIFVVKRSEFVLRLLKRLKFERIFSHIPQGDFICVNIKCNTYRPFTPPKNIDILKNSAYRIREVSILRKKLKNRKL